MRAQVVESDGGSLDELESDPCRETILPRESLISHPHSPVHLPKRKAKKQTKLNWLLSFLSSLSFRLVQLFRS